MIKGYFLLISCLLFFFNLIGKNNFEEKKSQERRNKSEILKKVLHKYTKNTISLEKINQIVSNTPNEVINAMFKNSNTLNNEKLMNFVDAIISIYKKSKDPECDILCEFIRNQQKDEVKNELDYLKPQNYFCTEVNIKIDGMGRKINPKSINKFISNFKTNIRRSTKSDNMMITTNFVPFEGAKGTYEVQILIYHMEPNIQKHIQFSSNKSAKKLGLGINLTNNISIYYGS